MEEVRGGPAGPFEDLECDPRRGGHADREVVQAGRRARAYLAPSPGPRPPRRPGPGTVAASGPRTGARSRPPPRARAPRVGPPQSVGDVPLGRPPGLAGHAAASRRAPAVGSELPARTPTGRRPPQGCVRDRAHGAEPGLAAGLLRVRDHRWRHLRLAGCRDYWSKYELGWHISPTANQHDAIAAIELALAEAERLAGGPRWSTWLPAIRMARCSRWPRS